MRLALVLVLGALTMLGCRAALAVHRHDRVRRRLDPGGGPGRSTAGSRFAWRSVAARTGRAGAARDRAVPEWLEGIARAVRGGSSVPQAVLDTRVPDALAADVAGLRRHLAHGVPAPQVFAAWRTSAPTHAVHLGAAALGLAAQGGGAMARALDAVAASLRDRQAIQREVRALAAQSQASAAVIAALPLGFAALAALAEPAVLAFLVTTPIGAVCLGAGLTLEVVGGLWMRRITRSTPW